MAIRYRPGRRTWEVYWNNPVTGSRQTKTFHDEYSAGRYNSEILHRLKYEAQSFEPPQVQESTDLTVANMVYAYLSSKGGKPTNLRFTILHSKPVLAAIGDLHVVELRKEHLQDVVRRQREAGVKQNTINRRISIIKSALTWAEDTGLIEANPVPRFSCPRGPDAKFPPPTPAEVDAVLSVAPEHIIRAVTLALALGVRVGESELFTLRWDHFDLGRGTVRIYAADKAPTRPYRDLHLREDIIPILLGWLAVDVRTGAGHPITYRGRPVKSIKRAWANTLKSAGITRRIRPYDLRHAFATYSLDRGADIKALSEVMGHTSTAMIHRHYQHVLERQRKEVMDLAPLPTFPPTSNAPFSPHFDVTEPNKIKQ
jgi:integrase